MECDVVGIRAYSARPELATVQPRLEEFVRQGGTLIVQYQSGPFPAPLPVAMGRMPGTRGRRAGAREAA